jgi:hypothetical protein
VSRKRRVEHRVRASVGSALYERIVREAAARRLSVSLCIRTDLEELYAIRDELSRPIEVGRDGQQERPRLVHRLLQETEARLAGDLGRQLAELASLKDAVRRVEAMVDRQYVGLMLHLPDVPEQDHGARARGVRRRYEVWQQAVNERLRDGGNTG